MINKRLLVKNLLAHNDENSFYDKKRSVDLGAKEGKGKFLKHICALANSNPKNNSYLVVGVEDEDNSIQGVDFFDDSKIQNLVNAYLENPPGVAYENIHFPHLPPGKVVGLVTIASMGQLCSLKKSIWKYRVGTAFIREGSISREKSGPEPLRDVNSETVGMIERHATNNIELTLGGVIDFLYQRHKDLPGYYKVFKEQFVVCWAGIDKKVGNEVYFSRVDIELINEQVKLFYSELDEITIAYDENSFTTIEYVQLGLTVPQRYYPLEKVVINFRDNGTYTLQSKLIFEPPLYNREDLQHIYNAHLQLLSRMEQQIELSPKEKESLPLLSDALLICYINGFEEAKDTMERARVWMRGYDARISQSLKEALRIIRKMAYN